MVIFATDKVIEYELQFKTAQVIFVSDSDIKNSTEARSFYW